MAMDRHNSHHPPPARSWKSLISHGYAYVLDMVTSSLGLSEQSTDDQAWISEHFGDTHRTKKRKRGQTDEEPTAIYSRIVPDMGESRRHHLNGSSNFSFKTIGTATSSQHFGQISKMTTAMDRPAAQTTSTPSAHYIPSSSTTPVAANNVASLIPLRNKLRLDSQHLSHLERVTDSLKVKIADLGSNGTTYAPRSRKMTPPKTNASRGSALLRPHSHSQIKKESLVPNHIRKTSWTPTYIKKEPLAAVSRPSTTTTTATTTTIAERSLSTIHPSPMKSSLSSSSPAAIMHPSTMESSGLHHGLLKRRKVLPDHPPPPGFSLKHVSEGHKNTMDVIIQQIPQVKLRRTETIRGPDGQWKPNPFWKEIYNNGKRRSRPL